MSEPVETLAIATAEAAAARQRLTATATELRERLRPASLARDARQAAAQADTRRASSVLVALVALAGLFLGRHRIAEAFRRFNR